MNGVEIQTSHFSARPLSDLPPDIIPQPYLNPLSHCDCGRSLHYRSSSDQEKIEEIIARSGPFIPMTLLANGGKNRTWMVGRHFCALHQIYARDLPRLAPLMGWDEVTEDVVREYSTTKTYRGKPSPENNQESPDRIPEEALGGSLVGGLAAPN